VGGGDVLYCYTYVVGIILLTLFLIAIDRHGLLRDAGHLEHHVDVGLYVFAVGSPLHLVQLFHLHVFYGPDVLEQRQFVAAGELAQQTVVHGSVTHVVIPQVPEQQRGGLVPLPGTVELQFVRAVGVIVARVAPHLDAAGRRHVLEFPLVLRPSLFHVVDVLQSLQMLVRLAVQLKVGFQVGLVRAQVANVIAGHHGEYLLFAYLGAVGGQVMGQRFQRVGDERAARAALEHKVGVLVDRFRRRFHRLRVEPDVRVDVRRHVAAGEMRRHLSAGHHLYEQCLVVGHVGQRSLGVRRRLVAG